MRIRVCGARGSTPAPGPDFVRYGGNTPCVAVYGDEGPLRLILDAGTGIRSVSALCDGQPFEGTILLGHLHWDHTQGLPFFTAGDTEGSRVSVIMPEQGDALQVMMRAMSPPHFPITPRQLKGRWRFSSIEEGEHEIEGFQITAIQVPHKGSRTFGYRISDGASTFTYLSDHDPYDIGPGPDGLGEYHEAAMELAHDVDLLIHDSHHTTAEFPNMSWMGHSAVDYSIGLAEEAGAKALWFFHHSPVRTDDAIDELVRACSTPSVDVSAAAEGMELALGQDGG